MLVFTGLFLGWLGLWAHELCHYLIGYISGARPRLQGWWFKAPTRVAFDCPDRMSDMQVKMTGGSVLIFPFMLFTILAASDPSSLLPLLPFLTFFAGAMGISSSDIMAIQNPGAWKRFAKGEPITKEDFE